MKIKIKNLYGIKNEIDFEFEKNGCIFAPNGVGKTSLYKGFKYFNNEDDFDDDSMEGTIDDDSITINGKNIKSNEFKVLTFDEEKVNQIINNPNDVIRNFINNKYQDKFLGQNIYKEFYNIYNEAKKPIKDKEINMDNHYIELKYDSTISISEIKKILNNEDELKYNNISECIEKIKSLEKDWKFLIDSQNRKIVTDYKKLSTTFQEIKEKVYHEYITKDAEIISLIEKYERFEYFQYKFQDDFINSKDALEKINKLLENNGISQEQIESYGIYEKNRKEFNKRISITLKSVIAAIEEEIAKLKENIHILAIKEKKEEFEKIEEKVKNKVQHFIKIYNENIKELNDIFLKNNLLTWKIKIQKIHEYHDTTKVEVRKDDKTVETEDLINYASSGQKRIIALLLATINADTNEYNLVIFDDVINSMDSDNILIFIDALSNIKTNFLFLTHNYQFISSIGSIKDLDIFIMDNSERQIITKIEKNSPLYIKWWSNQEVNNEENKVLFAATIIREIIDNYLNSSIASDKDKGEIYKNIVWLKNYIENTYRHYKTTGVTFYAAGQRLKSEINDSIKEIFKENKWLDILMNIKSDKIIADYVIDFKINVSFKSLVDYISNKYVLGLKFRFKFEKMILDKYNKRDEWNSGKILGIIRHPNYNDVSEELRKINSKILSLNHLNNLRWTPIVEMSISKINNYIKNLDEAINTKNN